MEAGLGEKVRITFSLPFEGASAVVANAVSTLAQKQNRFFFAGALVFFALLYAFFFGLFLIPFLDLGFYKMTPFSVWDGAYLVLASTLSAATLTLFLHARRTATSQGAFAGGLLGGAAGAVCPACLGVNFLAAGNVIALPLPGLVPYLGFLQSASLLLLAGGFWMTARGLECADCTAPAPRARAATETKSSWGGLFAATPLHKSVLYSLLALAVGVLAVFQLAPLLAAASEPAIPEAAASDADLVAQVLPAEGFEVDVVWGGIVKKMVDEGVLDPAKLENLLKTRYNQELKPAWRRILAGEAANEKLSINAENAVFMMYLLWTFAKHNQNPILEKSPFAKYFSNYDIGVGRAGYGDTALLALAPEQQALAERVALSTYRPCCGNPTGWPDCSHGFSALGLVELMASQGKSEEEIYDAFVKFNSFWFPATYIQAAYYFKLTEGKDWSEVDKRRVAGKEFSSLQGSLKVRKFLQQQGV